MHEGTPGADQLSCSACMCEQLKSSGNPSPGRYVYACLHVWQDGIHEHHQQQQAATVSCRHNLYGRRAIKSKLAAVPSHCVCVRVCWGC